MNRDSKTKSVRLSGVLDLFSEEKTGLEYDHLLQDKSGEKSPGETKEKKVNLFSFRKKFESDSKVYEKQTSKPLFRYLSSDHSSSEAKSLKGREESSEYETQVTLRKPPKHERNLILEQSNSFDPELSLGRRSLDVSSTMDRFSGEQVENQLSSSGEISPTACKGPVTCKEHKFFRFSSKQKVKLIETATIGLSPSVSSHRQIPGERDVKEATNVKTEILQSANNCEDVLLISHGESRKRIRSEGGGEELVTEQKAMTVNSELSSEFFTIEGSKECPETVSNCKIFPACVRNSQEAENERTKSTTDMPKNTLRKCFGFLRNMLIFLKSYVVLSIRFILYLPRDVLLMTKSTFLFIRGSCGNIYSRICKNKAKEDPKLQKQIDYQLPNDINPDCQKRIDRISKFEPRQGNEAVNNINESEISLKESKPKWLKILRQWSKDGRQKLNKGISASDFAEPEDVKWSTEFETVQSQGSRIESESLSNIRDTDVTMAMASKQRKSSFRSFISLMQEAFYFLLSVILFIPLNTTYVLRHIYLKISAVVFKNPIQTKKVSVGSTDQDDSSDPGDLRLDNQIEKVNNEIFKKTKYKYSLNVFGLIKKQKAGSEREMIKDDINPLDTTACISRDSKSGRTFEPKVLMRKIISFFSALLHFIGLCFITFFSFLRNVIAIFFAFIKLLLFIIIRFACLPFILLGKILLFILKCIRYLLQFLYTIIFGVIKKFCLVILLVLSLPIAVIKIFKIALCFLVDICWKFCITAVRFVNPKSKTQLQADSEENINTEGRLNEVYLKARGKMEKNFKKLHVNALFKRIKKSPESGAFSAGHSQPHNSPNESIGPVTQEPETFALQSDLKQGRALSKLFARTVKLFSKVLSIILAIPLSIMAVFKLTFRSLTSFMKINPSYPTDAHSVPSSDQESSPEPFVNNASCTPGESNDMNPFIHFQTANMKLHRSNSKEGYVIDYSADEGSLQTKQSFENLAKKGVTSVSENTESKESEGNKCTFDPRRYLKLTFPFFRVFFRVLSKFIEALWHKIDTMMSSTVKALLLGVLHLTPSEVIQRMALVAIRFTPGIKNRKILLTFLEKTPSKITKGAIETYVRKVRISVMMKHAQVTLKDSWAKSVIKWFSVSLSTVKKTAKSFFMSVSRLLKQVSKKLRIQKDSKRSALKKKVLIRLKSEDLDS